MRYDGRASRNAFGCREGYGFWIAVSALLLIALLVPPLLLPLLLVLTLGPACAGGLLPRALAHASAAQSLCCPHALRGPPRV